MRNTVILLVEDDRHLRDALKIAIEFELECKSILLAANGNEAIQIVEIHKPDYILLDIGLPGIDGLEVLRRIRKNTTAFIVVLTASDAIDDKKEAFELGADDYIVKPIDPEYFYQKAKNQIDRNNPNKRTIFTSGQLTLDFIKQEAWVHNNPVHFTTTQFSILELLAKNVNNVVSYENIFHEVWSYSCKFNYDTLKTQILKIRKLIETNEFDTKLLFNVYGKGYKMIQI